MPDNNALQPDSDSIIPRIKLGEQGFIGLKTSKIKSNQAVYFLAHC